jgi:hypothetical protein
MTISFLPPPLDAGAAELLADDVAAALEVALLAGALELDVDCELPLEPQPRAAMLRAHTIVASRTGDRAFLFHFMFLSLRDPSSRGFHIGGLPAN